MWMAFTPGRSVLNRATISSVKCMASQDEPPLPQEYIVPPCEMVFKSWLAAFSIRANNAGSEEIDLLISAERVRAEAIRFCMESGYAIASPLTSAV